ncbi:hypothetical protein ACSQ67_008525 [Phaseolus vulgaris]
MPGLTAPSDYSQEPPRHPSLSVNAKASQFIILFLSLCSPIFANSKYQSSLRFFLFPLRHRSMRSHRVRRWFPPTYSVSVSGLLERPKQIMMKDIWLVCVCVCLV